MNRVFQFGLAALVLAACTIQLVSLDDLSGETFADVHTFVEEALACGGDVVTVFDLSFAVGTPDAAAQVAREATLTLDVAKVLDAGGIWLLADDADRVLGAVGKTPGTVVYCSESAQLP